MKKKWFFLLILLVLIFFGWFYFFKLKPSLSQQIGSKQKDYFYPVTIVNFTSTQAPCVQVEIEGKTLLAMIDLGFQGIIEVSPALLETIKAKIFVSTEEKYGIKGKAYKWDFYKIPEMTIGDLSFFDLILEGGNEELTKDSIFVQNGKKSSFNKDATLGWVTFYQTNAFFDIGNSKIAFCNSLESLEKEGYSKELFTSLPLLLDRGLLEFEGNYAGKPTRFMLDSGCTVNMFNIPSEQPIEEVIWIPNTIDSSIELGEKDFGIMTFHQVPIKLPIHIDAILGMDFLFKHVLFIDFQNERIYFAPSNKSI